MTNMNSSDNFLTNSSLLTVENIIVSSVLSALVCVIIIGNVFALIILRTANEIKTTSRIFMASLAVADLCIGTLVGIPFILLRMVDDKKDGTYPLPFQVCEIHGFANIFFSGIEACTIAIVNLNILIEIANPLTYHLIVNERRASIALSIVWIMAGTLAALWRCLPGQGVYYVYQLNMCVYYHTDETKTDIVGIFYISTFIIAPMILTLVIYLKLRQITKRHQRQIGNHGNANAKERRAVHSNNKINQAFFFVTVGFLIGWIPLISCSFLLFIAWQSLFTIPDVIFTIAQVCLLLNSTWNVFIYYFRFEPFKRAAKRYLKRC